MDFIKTKPEDAGVKSRDIVRILDKLEENRVPMHSFLAARGNRLFLSAYYKPFDERAKHRLYSCTKSLVSLAIGALSDRKLISLSDKIVSYFPQYCKEEVHPYLAELTIENMLRMSTCHTKTTYKAGGNPNYIPSFRKDWVASFFDTAPDHRSGEFFFYDTSSTHVLCALVENLTGKTLLEFLREVFLDEIGCSKDMEALTDPDGHTQGGSGVLMRPLDLLKIMSFVGRKGDGLISEEYITKATTRQIETVMTQGPFSLDTHLGYGYQFWIMRNSSPAMFGLGGQFAICIPEKDLVVVTTADTQGYSGYDNLILNAVWSLAESVSDEDLSGETAINIEDKPLSLVSLKTEEKPEQYERTFKVDDPDITKLKIKTTAESGVLTLTKNGKDYVIPFGYGENVISPSPFENGGFVAASASFFGFSVSIAVKLLTYEYGTLNAELCMKEDRASLFLKLAGELHITGFSGLFECAPL